MIKTIWKWLFPEQKQIGFWKLQQEIAEESMKRDYYRRMGLDR
jgi:hypothetical protein